MFCFLCASFFLFTAISAFHGTSPGCSLRDSDTPCLGRIIRNLADLKTLASEKCTVIVGPLRILAMESCSRQPIALETIKEVTHFVEIIELPREYERLDQLLPNLTRIHGIDLCRNASLCLLFNPHLEELGLKRLVRIDRGGVHLENNYLLSSGSNVNWLWIMANHSWNINVNNSAFSEKGCHDSCQNCWGPEKSDCQEKLNASSCIVGSSDSLCTNVTCPKACVEKTNCSLFSEDELRCVERCKDVAVKAMNLSALAIRHSYQFENKCRIACPSGHYADLNARKCVKSDKTPCPQGVDFVGREVDAIHFKGCTSVSGNLTISIDLSDQLLERYFGAIVEVRGYVMVVHTLRLRNLNFLSNLTTIKGEALWNKSFSFVLYDNLELSKLHKTFHHLKVANGEAYIHSNPSLCFSAVADIKQVYNSSSVSEAGNSQRGICDDEQLNVTFTNETAFGFTVHWHNSSHRLRENKNIIGYSVYYREALADPLSSLASDFNFNDSVLIRVDGMHSCVSIDGCQPRTRYQVLVQSMSVAWNDSDARFRQMEEQSQVMTVTTATALKRLHIQKDTLCHPEAAYLKWEDSNGDSKNGPYSVRLAEIPWRPSSPSEWITERHLFSQISQISDFQICPTWQPRQREQCWLYNEKTQLTADFVKPYTKILYSPMEDVPCNCHSENSSFVNLTKDGKFNSSTDDGNFIISLEFEEHASSPSSILMELRGVQNFRIYWIQIRRMKDGGCSPWSVPNVFRIPPNCPNDIPRSLSHIITTTSHDLNITVTWEGPLHPNGRVLYYLVEFSFADNDTGSEWWQPTWKSSDSEDADGQKQLCESSISKYINENDASLRNVSVPPTSRLSKYSLNFVVSKNSLPRTEKKISINVRVYTKSLANFGSYCFWARNRTRIVFPLLDVEDNWLSILLGSVGSALAVILLLVVVLVKTRKKWRKEKAALDSVKEYFGEFNLTLVPLSPGQGYETDEWEVDRADVTLGDQLGEGAFGLVHGGTVIKDGNVVQVAIKSLLETSGAVEKLHFLKEASVMKKFSCNYVVRLLGIVSCGNPPLVIMELMSNGDLKNYLLCRRSEEKSKEMCFYLNFPFSDEKIFQIAAQIATGMAYLCSMNFVHRDLAARNCMVAKDSTVKIGDFGMTRDVYQNDYYRKHGRGPMPVRWMAPESLIDGVFTSASDVWSYGIVLWEISTLGALPYPGFSNEDVVKYASEGRLLDVKQLKHVPNLILALMQKCWRYQTTDRLSFIGILRELPALEGCEAVI